MVREASYDTAHLTTHHLQEKSLSRSGGTQRGTQGVGSSTSKRSTSAPPPLASIARRTGVKGRNCSCEVTLPPPSSPTMPFSAPSVTTSLYLRVGGSGWESQPVSYPIFHRHSASNPTRVGLFSEGEWRGVTLRVYPAVLESQLLDYARMLLPTDLPAHNMEVLRTPGGDPAKHQEVSKTETGTWKSHRSELVTDESPLEYIFVESGESFTPPSPPRSPDPLTCQLQGKS